MAKLAGKVAVITGASGGIGSAAAAAMLAEGAQIMLGGRDANRLKLACDHLSGGKSVRHHVGDPAKEADVIRLFEEAAAAFGGVDIVFANAGAEGRIAPLTALSVEEFDEVQLVNIRGTWLAIKHAVPLLVARGGGSIICTSSVRGQRRRGRPFGLCREQARY